MNEILNKETINRLSKMRSLFIGQRTGSLKDYWDVEKDLELYDLTFARRISWKWQSVLNQIFLEELFCADGKISVLDFGCGTGVATEKFLEKVDQAKIEKVILFDRSSKAVNFARSKIKKICSSIDIEVFTNFGGLPRCEVILISHILSEVEQNFLAKLIGFLRESKVILWVEPGTPEISKKLIYIRETLRADFSVIAPCTHNERCGLLEEKNKGDWCHTFASPPAEIYTNRFWSKFQKELKIDVRNLPVSYLVLKRGETINKPIFKNALIGRTRIYKSFCKSLVCSQEGIEEKIYRQKNDSKLYKNLCEATFSFKFNEV